MRVHVLHHGHCLDGIVSAAVFRGFYLQHVEPRAEIDLRPKLHTPGDPFTAADFDADDVACVDFRYSTHPRLRWWIDHHRSAFQLEGQRAHFDAHPSPHKVYDPAAESCAGLLAKTLTERFGFDATPHRELLHWAELVDSADFPDPDMPVLLREPALQLMTFAEHNGDVSILPRFCDDLMRHPLAEVAALDYVQRTLAPVLVRHQADIDLLRARCVPRGSVVEYDLLDQPPRIYNKFLAYFHHPQIRYVVGASVGPDGLPRLSVGYNPWLPPKAREHDIAGLCERFGGGGHPFVGGVTFAAGDHEGARRAQAWIADVLRGDRAP